MNRVLITAYHFPPVAGSSGVLRALKLCRYLPESGWEPTVLTVHPRAYERVDDSQLAEIPPSVRVLRTFALDTRRHLSVGGRYWRWMALPDCWASWILSAIPAGLRVIQQEHTDAILSTFPVPSSVLIGWILRRLTGKPWILDLRDSMTEDDFPRDPVVRRVLRGIEARAVRDSSRILFTAASTIAMYRDRYPFLTADRCVLVPNGYDEDDFNGIELNPVSPGSASRPLRLLHLGLLYPQERDPRPFFRAIARLKSSGRISTASVRIDLRASGYDNLHQEMLRRCGIEDIVQLQRPLPYREALADAAGYDGLLLFQAANCNHQIPAKVYEYLRLRKPVLALTDHAGDTAALLRSVRGATIMDVADEDAIVSGLPNFLASLMTGSHELPDEKTVRTFSRRSQAREVAACLTAVLRETVPSPTHAESVAAR